MIHVVKRSLIRAIMFVVLVTCFCSGLAFAESEGGGSWDDDAVVQGPAIYNAQNSQLYVVVYSGNEFNAALTALGYNAYDSKFTNDVKAYLSNQSTGGSFFEFVNLFHGEMPDAGITYGSVGLRSAVSAARALYGDNVVFWAVYNEGLASSAKQRVEEVLSGDVSGGSGEQPTGIPTDFTMNPVYYASSVNQQYNSQFTLSASLAQATINALSPYLDDYPYFFAYVQVYKLTSPSMPNSRRANLYVGLSKEPYIWNGNGETMTVENVYVYATVDFAKNGMDYKKENFSATSVTRSHSINITVSSSSGNVLYLYSGSGTGEPTVPPSNWPDNPTVVTPEPPELPEPRDPVIPNPPSDPVPTDPPTYITQPIYNVSVFTADLQGILDAMDEHCIHLQNALYTDLNALYNKLASTITEDNQKTRTLISNRFTWLGNVISECLDTLNDNLYDYFHWLAEQFDFQNGSSYNDDTLISWLKRIYYKLGKDSIVTRPSDPVADPFNFDDWLNSLWNAFLAFLATLVGGALTPIGNAIGALTDNFPFCLPWDMIAMFALLVAPPVAPNFDIPVFYLTGSGVQQSMQHVDLSPWTPYIAPLQLLFMMLYILELIHLTPKVMKFFRTVGGYDA